MRVNMDRPTLSLKNKFINSFDKDQKKTPYKKPLVKNDLNKSQTNHKHSNTGTPTILEFHQNKFLQNVVKDKKKILLQLTNMEKIVGYLLGYDNFSVTFVDVPLEEIKDANINPTIIFKHSILSMKEEN